MTKNTSKIKSGIAALAVSPVEITSGTVIHGSLDSTGNTISVQPSDDSDPIAGVMLSSVTGNDNGVILYPTDGSNIVIGTVDGPGEWTVLKMSDLSNVRVTIGNVVYEMDDTHLKIQNGSVVFNVGAGTFKLNTSSESLFQLLKDCFTYLTELTVSTSTGPSSIPINVADFTNLLTRLNNLLEA